MSLSSENSPWQERNPLPVFREFACCIGCSYPEACDFQQACYEDAGWLDGGEEND